MPRKKRQPQSSGGLTFVVATDLSKADPDTRKFIRSHVMLGKNAGRILPPRKKRPPEDSPSFSEDAREFAITHANVSRALAPISRRFGSKFATLSLADQVDSRSIDSILQFSAVAKQILFPLEPCIFFERRAEEWIGPLTTDPAYLHCLIYTSQHFFDARTTGLKGKDVPINEATMSHLFKGLRMLGDRMSNENDDMRLSNSTAAAVMGLSAHALVTDDLVFAKRHIDGLTKIVALRGGVSSFFGGSEKLLVEILRSDLGYVLAQGCEPTFAQTISHDALFDFPELQNLLAASHLSSAMTIPIDLTGVDEQLESTWLFMTDFTTLINFAAVSEQKISTPTFLHCMTSVMYRLVALKYATGSLNNMVKLGLLAFASSAFLQWRSIGMSYHSLENEFRRMLLVRAGSLDVSPAFRIWLMMVGEIAALPERDDLSMQASFRELLAISGMRSWQELRPTMMDFLWIPLIHDRAGEAVFSRLVHR